MEVGVPTDEAWLLLEGQAPLGLHCLQGVEALEAPVGERLIGEGPEVLGGLQLRRIRRQEHQVDALGNLHRLAGVPARPIEHQDDPLLWSRSPIASKGGEHLAEEDSRDGGQQPPLGLARTRADETTDIEPLVALLDGGDGACADRGPNLPDQGQEPDAMLVGSPELDRGAGMRRPNLVYPVGELC